KATANQHHQKYKIKKVRITDPQWKAVWSSRRRLVRLRYRRNNRQAENGSLSPSKQERHEDQHNCSCDKRGPDPDTKAPVWGIMNSFMGRIEPDHSYS